MNSIPTKTPDVTASTSKLFKVAGVCAMLTAVTTIAVHSLPALWSHLDTFEERLQLHTKPIYMTRLWIVILHCLLVVVSMYAIKVHRIRETPALVSLGFVAFLTFAYSEMLRTALIIFGVNRRWRTGYIAATDETARVKFRATIDAFSGIDDALFFVFFLAFFLGTLCYGVSLFRSKGWDQKLGALFLLWAALNTPTLIDTVTGNTTFSENFEWVGPYFQPIARLATGVWLFRLGSKHDSRPGPQRMQNSSSQHSPDHAELLRVTKKWLLGPLRLRRETSPRILNLSHDESKVGIQRVRRIKEAVCSSE